MQPELIQDLDIITIRAVRILAKAGITRTDDLLERTGADLLSLPGFTKKNLAEVHEALALGDSFTGPTALLSPCLVRYFWFQDTDAGAVIEFMVAGIDSADIVGVNLLSANHSRALVQLTQAQMIDALAVR